MTKEKIVTIASLITSVSILMFFGTSLYSTAANKNNPLNFRSKELLLNDLNPDELKDYADKKDWLDKCKKEIDNNPKSDEDKKYFEEAKKDFDDFVEKLKNKKYNH